MSHLLDARLACVSQTWTSRQRLHVGDVAWAVSGPRPDMSFEWGMPLLGFADLWRDGEGSNTATVTLHLSPDAGSELRAQALEELLAAAPLLNVEVSRQDSVTVAAFARRGFREEGGPWFIQLSRELGDLTDLDRHVVAEGYSIRSVKLDDEHDCAERVEVHRRSWAPARINRLMGRPVTGDDPPSSYTLDKHRAVQQTPVYRQELDVVVVSPDGSFVASGIGWLDDRNRSLLLEPVGSDPAHERRGLARALCAEILRVGAELGATKAVVSPRGDDIYPIARGVYQALAMRPVAEFVTLTNSPVRAVQRP